MITDEQLERESPEDVAFLLVWEVVDRLTAFSEPRPGLAKVLALKGIGEFAYKAVANNLTDAETMAVQLENMARYMREHMK